ncbi:MAG TPA: protein kinase, partial [Ktedonobacterales bacterium]
MSLTPGTILAGRYRILAQLGEGGMGSVYQAEDLRAAGRMWAIKELLEDPQAPPDEVEAAIKRFDAEFELMRHLSNPRIPAVVARFYEGGHHYFVMDLIPGESLETMLASAHAPLAERAVLAWTLQVCDVLDFLHAQRPPIILRDLKPGNIMVTPTGEVRLIDFGIARTYKLGKLSNTENLGTLTYASPEHLGQSVQTDARSDIYSLGATLYHLLTNTEPQPMTTPFPGALRRINPALSADTERVILRAMQLDPARRYQSAGELAAALRLCLAHLAPDRAPSTAVTPATTPPRAVSSAPVAPATPPTPAAPTAAPQSAGASGGRPPAHAPQSAGGGSAVPRLARVRGGVICPRCGYLNRVGARYCARDGILLPGAQPAPRSAPQRRAPVATIPVPAAAADVVARWASGGVAARGTGTGLGTAELSAQRGTDAFNAGRYAMAARHLVAAIAQGRATYETHLLLGRTYRQLHRPLDAATQFELAGRLRPTAEAYLQAGLAQREAGRATEAETALLRARQLNPHDPEIAYQLGLACLDQGRLAQAEGELEAGLALRPDHAGMLQALGRVRAARHQWDEASDLFRRAIAADPNDAGAYLDLGRALLALGHLKEATRSLEQAVQLAPDSVESQIALGMCYHAQG